MTYGREIQGIIDSAADTLQKLWGLERSFAADAAILFLYFLSYGLQPKVTSGWRSPEKQADLQYRYSIGDPSVVVKPAAKSQHSETDWLGNPAATAVDISTNNPAVAAQIATALGIGAGYYYSTPDRVHFYKKGS